MTSNDDKWIRTRRGSWILVVLMVLLIGSMGLMGCSDNPVSVPGDESMTTESGYNMERSLETLTAVDTLTGEQALK
jgi:hypothetical protein